MSNSFLVTGGGTFGPQPLISLNADSSFGNRKRKNPSRLQYGWSRKLGWAAPARYDSREAASPSGRGAALTKPALMHENRRLSKVIGDVPLRAPPGWEGTSGDQRRLTLTESHMPYRMTPPPASPHPTLTHTPWVRPSHRDEAQEERSVPAVDTSPFQALLRLKQNRWEEGWEVGRVRGDRGVHSNAGEIHFSAAENAAEILVIVFQGVIVRM